MKPYLEMTTAAKAVGGPHALYALIALGGAAAAAVIYMKVDEARKRFI